MFLKLNFFVLLKKLLIVFFGFVFEYVVKDIVNKKVVKVNMIFFIF